MTQNELNTHLGPGGTIIVEGKMLPGLCSNSDRSLGNMVREYGEDSVMRAISSSQQSTCLGTCLRNIELRPDDDAYEIHLPVPTEIVVVTPNGPDGVDAVICPHSGSRDKMDAGSFKIPMFDVEYTLDEVQPESDFDLICDSVDLLRVQFETEVLFDLLSKSVRSQRNRIDTPLSSESISSAMELIERESRIVENCVMNTRAFSRWRDHISDNGGLLFGARALCCSPKKRQNIKRNYFIGPSHMVGVFAVTPFDVQLQEGNVRVMMKMGATIFDRSLISSVDGPV